MILATSSGNVYAWRKVFDQSEKKLKKNVLIGQKIKGDLQHDLERIELSPLYFQISNLKEKLKVLRKSNCFVNYES